MLQSLINVDNDQQSSLRLARLKCREEIDILANLDNEYIIRFVEAFEGPREAVLVMEYLDGGELFERIVDDECELLESDCCFYLRQICCGLEYLHSKDVVHLDIKPENIVLRNQPESGKRIVDYGIKIIDFGTAKKLLPGQNVRTIEGTAEFMAPEVINFDDITCQADQWSVGVLTFVLLSGYSPFLGEDDNLTMSNVMSNKYHFDFEEFDEVSPEAKDFISRLLRQKPSRRLTAGDCLQHNWLKEKLIRNKNNRIKVSNLKKFLARRKVQNVGKALKVINVLKGAVRESTEKNSQSSQFSNSMSALSEDREVFTSECSEDREVFTSELRDIVKECALQEEKNLGEKTSPFGEVETLECSDNSDNSRDKSAKLKRSRTRASPGTVQDVLSRFAKRGDDDLEDVERPHQPGSARQPTYQRTSTKAAPGTVRNLRANFESQ